MCGWDDEDGDDVSALSDSFGPSIAKRLTKENEMITSLEESLLKDKVSVGGRNMFEEFRHFRQYP